MNQNNYPNKNVPLTTGVARYLIQKLFAGRDPVKRDRIVEDIMQHHMKNGGDDTSREKVTPAVKKVLSELEAEGLAERHPHSTGYWKIHKTQSLVSDETPKQTAPAQPSIQNEREPFEAELTDLASEAREIAARANALESKAKEIAARIRKLPLEEGSERLGLPH